MVISPVTVEVHGRGQLALCASGEHAHKGGHRVVVF